MTLLLKHQIMARASIGYVIAPALLIVVCAGCGGTKVAITGEVTFDGVPIDQGSIVFEPVDGKGPTTGGKIEAGRYTVSSRDDVVEGEKIVRITAVRQTGRQFEAGPPAPPGTMIDELEKYVPETYNRDSVLTCAVVEGANEHDFHLSSESSP